MSRSVFVSHATKDAELVAHLVDLIEDGIGVPEGEIFCSSLENYGIPAGENFVGHMREQMTEPKVVLLVLTQNYFQSHFCLSELGAAWVKGHKIFPIIVPPLTFADVKDVLLGTQVIEVANEVAYNQLRQALDSAGLATKSDTKWDIKRKFFSDKLPDILSSLPVPNTVDPVVHESLRKKLLEAQSELLAYEEEIDKLKKLVSRLEQAKDATEVVAIRREHQDGGSVQMFDTLVNSVSGMRSKVGGSEVLKFLIANYYGHSYGMDLLNYRDEFEVASLKKIVDLDSRYVNWSAPRAKELHNVLIAVDNLLSDKDASAEIIREYADKDVPMEGDNLEFWQEFYGV